jgi:hypothetical protein
VLAENLHRLAVSPAAYFSDELISLNLVFRLVPRPFTTAMMANEIPAAISPYSIAVAPDSSDQKALTLQLPYLKISESMGNHDSKIVDTASVD